VPEDAASVVQGPFDYVILCIKALPDVYDIAGVIESVVTPQHTCILVNATHALGVEALIEERFPTNVVLSLVSGAEISQLGQSEFEHRGSTEIWVGPANRNDRIPASIQEDMAQALAMTLGTGKVDCKVSSNIRQQQYERLIGYEAFQCVFVRFLLTARVLTRAASQSNRFPSDQRHLRDAKPRRPTRKGRREGDDHGSDRRVDIDSRVAAMQDGLRL
jgi:ketopantoate reductase